MAPARASGWAWPRRSISQPVADCTAAMPASSRAPTVCSQASSALFSSAAVGDHDLGSTSSRTAWPLPSASLRPIRSIAWMPLVPFVDRQDAGVAIVLRRAGLLDEAHAALHLQRRMKPTSTRHVGGPGLGDRREQVPGAASGRASRSTGLPASAGEIGRKRRWRGRSPRAASMLAPSSASACDARPDGRTGAREVAAGPGRAALFALQRIGRAPA